MRLNVIYELFILKLREKAFGVNFMNFENEIFLMELEVGKVKIFTLNH